MQVGISRPQPAAPVMRACGAVAQVRALVERDPEIRSILKDVRKQIDINAAREVGLEEKSLRPLKRGNSTNLSNDPSRWACSTDEHLLKWPRVYPPEPVLASCMRSASRVMDESQRTKTQEAKLSIAVRRLFGPVLHPDGRFRSIWNVMLAVLICYCGVAVPLEIAFDTDMSRAMCGVGEDALYRRECHHFLAWYWTNVGVDVWFLLDVRAAHDFSAPRARRPHAMCLMVDASVAHRCPHVTRFCAVFLRRVFFVQIVVSLRTGYMQEGHFVNDDGLAASKYLRSSFALDFLGSFPLNLLWVALQPDNPYGDEIITMQQGDATGTGDVGRVNRVLRMLRLAKMAKLARMAKLYKYMTNFEE
jgi:hypothetical protein